MYDQLKGGPSAFGLYVHCPLNSFTFDALLHITSFCITYERPDENDDRKLEFELCADGHLQIDN